MPYNTDDLYYPELYNSEGELDQQQLVDSIRLLWESVYQLKAMLDTRTTPADVQKMIDDYDAQTT